MSRIPTRQECLVSVTPKAIQLLVIYDYVDFDAPVLARMFEKRRRGYKAIGYEIEEA